MSMMSLSPPRRTPTSALAGAARLMLTIAGLVAVALVVVTLRFAAFEYFHDQVLRGLLGQ